VPGVVDARIQQNFDYPKFHIAVDRTKASEGGFTPRDITTSLLVSLSGSFQTTPTFFLNWQNGVNYNLVEQTPQYAIQSLQDFQNIPITSQSMQRPEILADVASITRANEMAVLTHYNIRRVVDVYASVQDRDLGGAAREHHAHRGSQPEAAATGQFREYSRPDPNHAHRLHRFASRSDVFNRAGVFADRGEFSILAGSVHHHHRAFPLPWRASRCSCSLPVPH